MYNRLSNKTNEPQPVELTEYNASINGNGSSNNNNTQSPIQSSLVANAQD